MNDELRKRLVLVTDRVNRESIGEAFHPYPKITRQSYVDAILSEIEAAGYVIVNRERWDRVANAAGCYVRVWRDECDGDEDCAVGNAGLLPGDLEGEE